MQDIPDPVSPDSHAANTDLQSTQFAIDAAGLGTWDISLTTPWTLTWNDRCRELFRADKNTTISSFEEAMQFIHPEDREAVRAATELELDPATGGDFNRVYRIKGQTDNEVRWLRSIGKVYFTDGKPHRFSGISMDVTAEYKTHNPLEVPSIPDLAIKNASIGTFRFDLVNRTAQYSTAFAAIITGDANNKMLTRESVITRVHPDDGPLRDANILSALKEGELYYEPRVVWDDGSVHRVRIIGWYIFDDKGTPLTLSGTVKEITEQERQDVALQNAEAAIRQSEAMFRNVTSTSPTGLWMSDEEGLLVYLNKTLKDWTGMAYESLLGNGWVNSIIEGDRPKAIIAFSKAIAERKHYDIEFRLKKGTGEIIWCHSAGDPYYREDGSYAGYVGFCMDINEQVIAEDNLKVSEERLRAIIEQSPVAISLLTSREMVVQTANETMLKIWGKNETIIGLPLIQALPELKGQGFTDLLENVYDTGEAFYGYSTLAKLEHNNVLVDAYFDFVYTPMRNADGVITGVMVLATEVTTQVLAHRAVEESEARFRSLVEEAPIATCLFVGRDMVIEVANDIMLSLWGKGKSVLGKPFRIGVPEMEGQRFLKILDGVFTTGIPYVAKDAPADLEVNGVLSTYYFDFTYKPLRNADGEVYAIMNMAIDVTAQVKARQEIEESELFARSVIHNSPVAKIVFVGENLVIKTANENLLEMLGRTETIIGKPFAEAFPELTTAPILTHLKNVLVSGGTFHQPEEKIEFIRNGQPFTGYYNYIYKALPNTAGNIYGVMITATEVTEQVLSRNAFEASEHRLRSLVESAPFPIGVYIGKETKIELANQAMIKVFGKGEDVIGKYYKEILPELENQAIFNQLDEVYNTGVPFHSGNQRVDIVDNGTLKSYYFNYSFTPLFDSLGKVYGVMNTGHDITDLEFAKQQIEQTEASLRSAIELAELGTWSINLSNNTLEYSPRLREWFGFAPDEIITLEAAYGVVSENDRDRVIAAIERAFDPAIRSIYDVEYTIINKKNKKQLIIHAQGKAFFNEKGEAFRVIGTAQDVTKQRKIQLALEQEVQKRTEELQAVNEELASTNEELNESNDQLTHSNQELEQYAYIASHDLQEPLRKIRVFSDMLGHQQNLSEENKALVTKITQSSERMSVLIKDLLEFSRLLKSDSMMRPVDLSKICKEVINDFELSIQEKDAMINVGKLPVIEAISLQMNQLFYNLLSNALKFINPDKKPRVEITSEALSLEEVIPYIRKPNPNSNYYRITFKDNGIGFDVQYAEQIFEVFKRLHGRDAYPGSGIGLALCRRIAANHKGFLYAESAPGMGASFHIILPANS